MLQGFDLQAAFDEVPAGREGLRTFKTRMSIEKNIENMWLKSQELGWNYQEFVTQVLEIMVVINHRSRLAQREEQSQPIALAVVSPPQKVLA